jgi:Putative transposase, YhgA-like
MLESVVVADRPVQAMSNNATPSPEESISHDQNFKELISTFFMEFLELFVPEFAETIDPTSITFLQQEYFIDLVEGEEKIVDLLAEVKLAGQEATILIHIEPQSTSQTIFPQRLFFYFSRLHQKHLKLIYPIALFSYDKRKKQPKIATKSSFPTSKYWSLTSPLFNLINWTGGITSIAPTRWQRH